MSNYKEIAFIEPAGSESNVFENYMKLPLMGTLYLGTILANRGHRVRIYNENILPTRIDPFDIKADVYCISTLTVSANRGKHLAQEFKRIYPSAKVIIGGIHASLSAETFHDCADHIVLGEAESIIAEVIEDRINERIVQGQAVENLDDLPLINYDLLEGIKSMDIIPVITSRGCPFDCNFCTVTKIFGKKFRMQSPERVIQEIRHSLKFFRTRTIFFYDDNFAANHTRVSEICRLIEQNNLDINWVTQVRSDIARDPQLIKKMERAGCRFFFIGFESINDETLKAMHKSQTRKDIETAIHTIREHGINIHGMFIFGDDRDTPDSIRATVDFALRQHIDTVQFMILTPFPGTSCFHSLESEKRLIHRRWDFYNGMYAVFRPVAMSASRLQQETIRAYERFYSLRRLIVEALRLFVDLTLDALTWNFSNVFNYSFDTIFLKAGARFLVGRYARTFDSYLLFLQKIEQQKINGEVF